ncbi:MAG TPA: hypothetical protein VEB41_13280 [Burkholderiales bacterium]|nr:hypothetical protein [Burkholderiales bacterium]
MQSAGGPRYFAAHYRMEALERQLDRARERGVQSNAAASLFIRNPTTKGT